MSSPRTLVKKLLPLLILLISSGVALLLIHRYQPPAPRKPADRGVLVEVLTVRAKDHPVTVFATGTVQPAQRISIIPQVRGKATQVAERFKQGGFFRKGELLLAIDDADYRLTLERARAAVAKAELKLAQTDEQARIARLEWQQLQAGKKPPPLAAYQPQLKEARRSLAAARADLAQARLDLERTRITAPFDCLVLSESVDQGQYLKEGTAVAEVAGTGQAEVIVPLPLADLAWLSIPGSSGKVAGSPATVLLTVGHQTHRWQGRVSRSLGEVDPKDRLLRLVVAVSDPYGRKLPARNTPPLAFGLFVDLRLAGSTLHQVFPVPRKALHQGDTVWLMDKDHRLRIRKVQVARVERDLALISRGLTDGDRLVVTELSGAADGMLLRTRSGREEP